MFGQKDIPSCLAPDGDNSQSKLSRHVSECDKENPDEKIGFPDNGIDFLRGSETSLDRLPSKSPNIRNPGSQELTLSYLCDNPKLASPDKDNPARNLHNSFDKATYKGKEVAVSENFNQDEKWVERDFLNLNETTGNSSKREIGDEVVKENREKKPKLETLNLSLALPDVSLSLTASDALQNEDPPFRSRPTRSILSLAPSNNNTQTTCSNDFTAASLSYTYSHPFSHNPSCSLTRNSTENYEYSAGRDDQIWNCGEGTNGSVHSRFKPFGDGVALSNHGGGGLYSLMQGSRPMNKDNCNSHYMTTSSDNHSFFPSELPARPTQTGADSRGKASESLRGLESTDGGRARKLSRPERILREIVWESLPDMSQIVQEFAEETLASTKEYLKRLIEMPEKKEEFAALQYQLERRSDLTRESLSKCQKDHLEILVSIKLGLASFISGKSRSSSAELVDIFLLLRCRNCKAVVPVDDCDCKICSSNKGFCSSCMCPICLNFDCANNTCSWVGCDVCSHWCHAACGIRRNLIRPGPSLKGPSGTSEMQFHCIGCDHASEMFGFVKDVFMCCAKDWGLETLMKELDCVRKIFRASEDYKGKELYIKADEMLCKLESKIITSRDACNVIINFFHYADSKPEFQMSGVATKELVTTQTTLRKDGTPPQSSFLPAMYTVQKLSSSVTHRDLIPSELKPPSVSELKMEDEFRFVTTAKKDGLESLESIVRIKEAEARMFQGKADDARREAEGLRRIIIAKTDELEKEYVEKLGKLCLHETEERRKKKLEELKALENAHVDYYNMKMRMQTEIAGLLQRMEATKKQLA